jgi:hypothetical protein
MKSKILILVGVIIVAMVVRVEANLISPVDEGKYVIGPSGIDIQPVFRALPATNANVVGLVDGILKQAKLSEKSATPAIKDLIALRAALSKLPKDARINVDFALREVEKSLISKIGAAKQLVVTIEVPNVYNISTKKEAVRVPLVFDLTDKIVAAHIAEALNVIDKLAEGNERERNLFLGKAVNGLLGFVTEHLGRGVSFAGIDGQKKPKK